MNIRLAKSNRIAAAILMLVMPFAAHAENWPQWRGAKGDGVSTEKNPPIKWSGTENIAWKANVKGKGSSTPVIFEDRIFLTSQTEDEQEWMICLDRKDGKLLWEKLAGKGMMKTRAGANMASATAATDGERTIFSFGTGELICLDNDGNELWKKQLQDEFAKFTIWWGYSNSPIIYNDMVLITLINEGPSFIAALDKKTGALKWKTDRKTEAASEPCDSYATPIIYEANGRTEVFITGALWATAYSPENGAELWKANIGGDRTILSPTYFDGMVYVTAGKRGPLFAIQPGGSGDVTKTHIKWNQDRTTPDCPSPVGWGDYVYFVNDTGVAMCMEKKRGTIQWVQRVGGDHRSSPIAVDGKIYFTNLAGETTVIEAGAAYKPLSVNQLGENAAMGSLAISQGQLFQRSETALYCIGTSVPDVASK